jgi:glycosyltransferase involved in cell wall biosynthesis
VRVAWLSYLDPLSYSGGGELSQRMLIEAGRALGHEITIGSFLKGSRASNVVRRAGLRRAVEVDWNADVIVLANIRNCPQLRARFPEVVVRRALNTGRAAILQQAWVDVCPLDVPCQGNPSRCEPGCTRSWANELYANARVAIFNSPRQRDTIAAVLDVPLPAAQVLIRPMIDTTRFRPSGVDRDLDVLYVGTISAAKGYHNLLARFGGQRLTFVGQNLLNEPIRGSYLGEMPHDELPGIYSRARTFAHLPNWIEPMGRSVVEAALCGCEIVVNDRVGVTSYPKDTWTDHAVVATHGATFWREFESLAV